VPLLVAVALVGAGALAFTGGEPSGEGPYAELDALREAANEAHLANGDEAAREGSGTPAEEQVANRAYPRTYVDDRQARREQRAFSALPDRPPRSSFSSGTRFRQALAAAESWTALGPTTPNVAGEASQFWDYETEEGPPTQESGRVTAIAIEPSCGSESKCRMWVAAAGGGIWRTEDAMATPVEWIEPAADLPTNAFGSLYYDAGSEVLYAGSGEPNGSSDSEAGLGLFESTDFGASWTQVPGSVPVATNRSIGAIAVDPTEPETIYIGTDVARHGSSSVNGGRFTPPSAPALGVYRSTDGGAHFSLETNLEGKTPPSPNPASSGVDWFQGGVNKLELDPNDHSVLYAAVFGYGVWRADQPESVAASELSWERVFHTMNQNDFSNPEEPLGDTLGDRTEFDLVDIAENGEDGSPTRMYVGDASDEWATEGDEEENLRLPEAWRNDDVAAIAGEPDSTAENEAQGWVQLSSEVNGTKGFGAYGYCQNGQCAYDSFVAHPSGAGPGTVWYGGSMNYDELPAYGGEPPRSNGRAVIRSTNGGEGTSVTAPTLVEWQDMTAVLKDPSKAWGVEAGIHPDLHAIAFANGGATAFIGSDGGVVRLTVGATQDQSESCEQREYEYTEGVLTPLLPADKLDCEMLLGAAPSAIEPLNKGLNDLQFQSLSFDPQHPADSLLGGTQDNGTWGYEASLEPEEQWEENVGGDGGQSGFDAGDPSIRYHNYYSPTPEVNFNGNDPNGWFDIYDPLLVSEERSSFYTPFIADPQVPGRAFTGLEHVWRTNDHGGSQSFLETNGCSIVELDPSRTKPCGDWKAMGASLTGSAFGSGRAGQYVVAIARAPSDPGTLWAATRTGRLFVTKNADAPQAGSVSFYRIDTPSTPGRFVSGISVDPADPNRAWVSYSGYNAYTPSTTGHVFEVRYDDTAHSAAFTDLSGNIGDQPVTGVAADRTTCDLYASTDFGVLKLPEGSSTWIDSGSGLPKAAVFGLSLSESGRVLYAATHGRGAYALALPSTGSCPTPPPPEPPPPAPAPSQSSTTAPPPSQPETAHAFLRRIWTVRQGHKTKVAGRASASAGLRTVKLGFGDGHRRVVKVRADGTFVARHRYRRAKKYPVKLWVIGRRGEFARAARIARVKPKHRRAGSRPHRRAHRG